MQSDSSWLHPEKAWPQILDKREGESKITEVRREQLKKQWNPTKRTFGGMEMVFSEEQHQNASVSISRSRDPDSNVTVDKDEQ
jgi:hypothetical protein